jgi:hypothetical protein
MIGFRRLGQALARPNNIRAVSNRWVALRLTQPTPIGSAIEFATGVSAIRSKN